MIDVEKLESAIQGMEEEGVFDGEGGEAFLQN